MNTTQQTEARCGVTTWTGHACGSTRTVQGVCTNSTNHTRVQS